MRKSRESSQFALALTVLLLLPPAAALAQETDSTSASAGTTTTAGGTNTSTRERLYLNFAEDAMIVDEQWWEGWLQYDDSDLADRTRRLRIRSMHRLWAVRINHGRAPGSSTVVRCCQSLTRASCATSWASAESLSIIVA